MRNLRWHHFLRATDVCLGEIQTEVDVFLKATVVQLHRGIKWKGSISSYTNEYHCFWCHTKILVFLKACSMSKKGFKLDCSDCKVLFGQQFFSPSSSRHYSSIETRLAGDRAMSFHCWMSLGASPIYLSTLATHTKSLYHSVLELETTRSH